MSQWLQVFRIALCITKEKVTELVSQLVTRSPIELFWTAKNRESILCSRWRNFPDRYIDNIAPGYKRVSNEGSLFFPLLEYFFIFATFGAQACLKIQIGALKIKFSRKMQNKSRSSRWAALFSIVVFFTFYSSDSLLERGKTWKL